MEWERQAKEELYISTSFHASADLCPTITLAFYLHSIWLSINDKLSVPKCAGQAQRAKRDEALVQHHNVLHQLHNVRYCYCIESASLWKPENDIKIFDFALATWTMEKKGSQDKLRRLKIFVKNCWLLWKQIITPKQNILSSPKYLSRETQNIEWLQKRSRWPAGLLYWVILPHQPFMHFSECIKTCQEPRTTMALWYAMLVNWKN